jgi:hypothetical protein
MKMISKALLVMAAVGIMAVPAMAADKLIVRNDGNTADVFKVNGTTGLTEVGSWTGAPPTVAGYLFNVAGDFFAGNVGANTGRFRLSSNANAGFIYWNTWFNGTSSYQSDVTKPTWAVRIDGVNDKMQFRRAAPTNSATTTITLVDMMVVQGNGNVGIGTGAAVVTSKLQVVGLPTYTSNANAKTGGLTDGAFYTDGSGNVKVVIP